MLAGYAPIQLVAPSAVTMAVATDAMICTMNLNVSLFVMVFFLSFFGTDLRGSFLKETLLFIAANPCLLIY